MKKSALKLIGVVGLILLTGCGTKAVLDNTKESPKTEKIQGPSPYEKAVIDKYLKGELGPKKEIKEEPVAPEPEAALPIKKETKISPEQMLQAAAMVWSGRGYGSGFYLGPDGLFVTAAHVVESNTTGIVYLEDISGQRVEGRVIKVDEKQDLALIRTQNKPSHFLNLSAQKQLPNQICFILGAGGTQKLHVTPIRYQLYDAWCHWEDRYGPGVQPGDSGGAVIDENGNVVGDSCAKDNRTGDTLCVPVQDIKDFVGNAK